MRPTVRKSLFRALSFLAPFAFTLFSLGCGGGGGGGEEKKPDPPKIALSVIDAGVSDKVYDGTTAATCTTASAQLVGVVPGDTVTLNASSVTATFPSANVGTYTFPMTGFTLAGSSATKYTLAQPSATAKITQRTLTVANVTANNKVYDGTTAATLNKSAASLVGVVSGDNVTLDTSFALATFASAQVGTHLVQASGFALLGDANKTGNYLLMQPSMTASILPAPPSTFSLVVKVNGADVPVTVTLNPGNRSGVTVGGTCTFSNVGNGTYTVTPTPIAGFLFDPTSKTVNVNGGDATVTFTATVDKRYNLISVKPLKSAVFKNEWTSTENTIEVEATGEGFTLEAEFNPPLFAKDNFGDYKTILKLQKNSDGKYSVSYTPEIPISIGFWYLCDGKIGQQFVTVKARDVNGNVILSASGRNNVNIYYSCLDESLITPVTQINSDVWVTSKVINIQIPDVTFSNIYQQDREIAKKIYGLYPDNFDYLVMHRSKSFAQSRATAYVQRVSNSVTGTGFTIFDNTSLYGSSGKLSAHINIYSGGGLSVIMHEIAHGAVSLKDSRLPIMDSDSHIVLPSTIGGHLCAGSLLVSRSATTFEVVKNTFVGLKYSPLEMYGFGWGTLEEALPQHIAKRDANVGEILNFPDEVLEITPELFRSVYGSRNPATSSNQKRIGIIVVSSEPASQALMSAMNALAGELENAFLTSTSGKATLDATLPPRK